MDAPAGSPGGSNGLPGGVVLRGPELNPRWRTVVDMLLHAPAGWSATFVDQRERETRLGIEEIRERASAVAGALAARGVRRGDRVALILGSGPEYLFAFFGAQMAGAVVASLPPRHRLGRSEEHEQSTVQQLKTMEARLVVTEAGARRMLGGVLESARPELGCAILSELNGVARPPQPVDPEDLAIIQFSSGSTMKPKAVGLSHRNVVAQCTAICEALEFDRERVVSWLPLYHDMGLIGLFLCALDAESLVLIPPELFIARPGLWLRALARHRGTLTTAPNFAYALCVRKVMDAEMEGLDLSAWRHALCGAEQVSPEVIRRFCQRFAKWGFRPEALIPVYGLAEATLGVTFCRHGPLKTRTIDAVQALHTGDVRPGNRELASVGVPISGVEVQIREDAGRALPPERLGRIFVRGPSVMKGYFNDQEATSATLIDGWLDTGDVGFIADGELFIYGRSKEIIIIRGANRTPQEFEECLEGISGLRPGCAVAAGFWPEGAEQEELLLLAERSRRGDAPPEAVVIERIRVEVTRRTGVRPHTVALLDPGTLPKTTSGKWRRGEALKRYLTGTLHPPRRPGRFELVAEAVRSRLAHARLWFSA